MNEFFSYEDKRECHDVLKDADSMLTFTNIIDDVNTPREYHYLYILLIAIILILLRGKK